MRIEFRRLPARLALTTLLQLGLCGATTACGSGGPRSDGAGGGSGAGGEVGGAGASGDTAGAGASGDTAGAALSRCSVEEPADEAALIDLADWPSLPSLRPGKLVEMTSTDRETTTFPGMPFGNHDYNNYICRGIESVVASGGDFGPLVIDLPNCPEAYVKGLVAARFEGSGRLVRLWETGVGQAGLDRDAILRIYVDDDPEPCIEVTIGDAKTPPPSLEIFGFPFGAGTDSNLAWYYPVVFSTQLLVTLDNLPDNITWYQASAVLDQTPVEHQAGGTRLAARDRARDQLMAIATPVADTETLTSETLVLPTDTPVPLATLTGPATIYSLRVSVPDAAVAALDAIDVDVTWDGAATPAISMPLGDLYASRMGLAASTTTSLPLAITSAEGQTVLELRLPMPFASQAVIVLTNHGSAITLDASVAGLPTLPPEPWGHLFAVRSETVGPTSNPFHPMVSETGEGRLVGTCLMAQGHDSPLMPAVVQGSLNFLEGDELIEVDGEPLRGTGTEDYFDSALYFESPMSGGFPFAQWGGLVADETNDFGTVTACRWHILNAAIDFHQSLNTTIEIGPPDPAALVRYVSTSYLYLRDAT
jgi:hypothetical protein